VEGKKIKEGLCQKRYLMRSVREETKKRDKTIHRCTSDLRVKKDNKTQILLLIITQREKARVLQRRKSVRISVQMPPKSCMKLHIFD
jgi:c-di-GMP-binding flagellar brake protein YcgR